MFKDNLHQIKLDKPKLSKICMKYGNNIVDHVSPKKNVSDCRWTSWRRCGTLTKSGFWQVGNIIQLQATQTIHYCLTNGLDKT